MLNELMNRPLTEKQMKAIEKFKYLKVGAVFMKMGTGKTRVACELVNYNDPDYLLYITPHSTIENIREEIQKWVVKCEYDIEGYEGIASGKKKYSFLHDKVERLKAEGKKLFIIADESIFIKNGRSKRTIRCKELRKFFDYALVLNGTPIVKSEWDLFNQMDFLSEKILQMNSYEFLEKFFVEHIGKKHGREFHYYTFYEPNRPALTKMCAPYVFEADLDFEHEETEKCIWVDYSYSKYYDIIRKCTDDYSRYREDSLISMFTLLQKEAALASLKNITVSEYIEGKQIICFCSHIEEVEQIKDMLEGECYVITGDTSKASRVRIMEEFKNDTKRPLIMTLGVGSYSLNLQFCNEIVYSSITFNYGSLEQSRYRIKRTGQSRDIRYTYILSDLGINHMMFRNIDRKESLSMIIKKLLSENDVSELIERND